jgi:hypothetical protein
VEDANAMLFDDHGAHPPKAEDAYAVVDFPESGPCWGWGACLAGGHECNGLWYANLDESSYPTWTAKGTKVKETKDSDDGEDSEDGGGKGNHCITARRVWVFAVVPLADLPPPAAAQPPEPAAPQVPPAAQPPTTPVVLSRIACLLKETSMVPLLADAECAGAQGVNIGLFGFPQSGKSRLGNGLVSAFSGRPETAFQSMGGAMIGGQHTVCPLKVPLCKRYLRGRSPQRPYEVNLWDFVGHRSLIETMACVRGQVKSGEEFPEKNDDGVLGALLSRPSNIRSIMTCMILLVPAVSIADEAYCKELAKIIRFVANIHVTNEAQLLALPMMLVLTNVDRIDRRELHSPTCLLEGSKGPLKSLYEAAESNLGMSPADVFCTGWLHEDDISFSVGEDGKVGAVTGVLRSILVEAVKRAAGPWQIIGPTTSERPSTSVRSD